MATGLVISKFAMLNSFKLMPQSGRPYLLQQGSFPLVQHYWRRNSIPIQATVSAHARHFRLLHGLNKNCKGPQNVNAISVSAGSQVPHSESFSVLKYVNKPAPLSVRLDVPIGSFSTGPMKDIGKNLGNFAKTKKRSFEFLSLRQFFSTPSPFMLYSIGGIIPFSSVPIYMQLTSCYCSSLAQIQLVYGACILSFLGGVTWGFELLNHKHATFKSLGYSVSLPLVAWSGVLLYPSLVAFPLVISGVAAAGYVDVYYQSYPVWFKNLRFFLTLLVILSLISTFVLSLTRKDKCSKLNDNAVSVS